MSSTTALHAQWEMLFPMQSALPQNSGATRQQTYAHLDMLGEDQVLEYISRGRLPNELAIDTRLPIVFVNDWIADRVDAKRLERAYQGYAQSCILKANLALSVQPENPQEAQVIRAMSEHMVWVAERSDPSRWGPPRKAEPPPPTVNLVFNIPPKPGATAVSQAPEITLPAITIEQAPTPQPSEAPDDVYEGDEDYEDY